MIIIGLNAYHGDAAACLVRDGKIIAAAEEERFCRIKHWAGLPTKAISYCLDQAGITLADVDYIAVNSKPQFNLWRKVGFALMKRPQFGLIWQRLHNQRQRLSIKETLARSFPNLVCRATVVQVEHHLAHLASCFYVAPFNQAVVLSVDGFGDFASAAWGVGHDMQLAIAARVYFPHSLGIFYQALTQYLGFLHYGDEYKVMGLAPYGKPTYLQQMRQIVELKADGSFKLNLNFFRHHKEHVTYQWSDSSPETGILYSDQLEALLGPARLANAPIETRYYDIAYSVQAMYEEAFFNLLHALHKRYNIDKLTLAGGCAMNSVANGKIYRRSPFRQVYIQAAAGDAGGAMGAALVVAHKLGELSRQQPLHHAYLGPAFNDLNYQTLIETHQADLVTQGCYITHIEDEHELCCLIARHIAAGLVIGWFQGRMEWGPRALGNRSILADPRRADMKDILNRKIKRRESFRPFAPSILREAVSAWFEEEDDVPFMMQVFQIRQEKRAAIPAVTHVDGSGRLQTVHKNTNPLYYQLIEQFAHLTGVPMVLNTSFNENEPIVCRPDEALDCFLRTQMDILVLGQYVLSRYNVNENQEKII